MPTHKKDSDISYKRTIKECKDGTYMMFYWDLEKNDWRVMKLDKFCNILRYYDHDYPKEKYYILFA